MPPSCKLLFKTSTALAGLFVFLTLNAIADTPNIVIIVCDDLNDTIEGIGGHPQAYTPNINRLIESGVRFTNAASNAPICGPSRASLWSGIHPVNSGMYGADQQNNRWDNNVILKNKKTLFKHLSIKVIIALQLGRFTTTVTRAPIQA